MRAATTEATIADRAVTVKGSRYGSWESRSTTNPRSVATITTIKNTSTADGSGEASEAASTRELTAAVARMATITPGAIASTVRYPATATPQTRTTATVTAMAVAIPPGPMVWEITAPATAPTT